MSDEQNILTDEPPPVTQPKGLTTFTRLLAILRRAAGVGNPWVLPSRLVAETGLSRREVEAALAKLAGTGHVVRTVREEDAFLVALWRASVKEERGAPRRHGARIGPIPGRRVSEHPPGPIGALRGSWRACRPPDPRRRELLNPDDSSHASDAGRDRRAMRWAH
jgi:hypothetical protein